MSAELRRRWLASLGSGDEVAIVGREGVSIGIVTGTNSNRVSVEEREGGRRLVFYVRSGKGTGDSTLRIHPLKLAASALAEMRAREITSVVAGDRAALKAAAKVVESLLVSRPEGRQQHSHAWWMGFNARLVQLAVKLREQAAVLRRGEKGGSDE